MRIFQLVALTGCLLLPACAGGRMAATPPPGGYVEVDNPTVTMSPNAPEKIWVPRSAVETGPPRGGELLKEGAKNLIESVQPPPR